MIKATGIVRKVDELGRVVVPIELRRSLGIEEKDALEIYVDGERILLKKYEPACVFCSSAMNTAYFKGKLICHVCLEEMAPGRRADRPVERALSQHRFSL